MAARLDDAMLSRLPPGVRRPNYDRSATRIGFAHIGVGAFHRCHQAEYTEDVLEAGADVRAEIGINIRPPAIVQQLGDQDGLYTRRLVDGGGADLRVIGAICRVLDAADDPRRAVSALADPALDVISMTVTEKGYCRVPATGALDEADPVVAADLRRGAGRLTLPGFLADVLAARRAARAPVTLLSCDNIPANGRVLRSVVIGFAERVDRDLAGWIADSVRFPSTMVDRIVPATTPEDLARIQREAGCRDAGAVVGEPFRQWVIENDFNRRRPLWDLAGAEFAADVEAYEFVKMRVLNACQSALCWLGALAGHETTGDDVRDPLLVAFAERMILAETAAVLPNLSSMPVGPYTRLTFERLANPAIRHRNHRIATDSSQKINQRILQPLRERSARGLVSPLLETAVAAWIAYLARSQEGFGARWRAEDPLMPVVARCAQNSDGSVRRFAEQLLAERSVFGALAGDAAFVDRVADGSQRLVSEGVERALARAMSAMAADPSLR